MGVLCSYKLRRFRVKWSESFLSLGFFFFKPLICYILGLQDGAMVHSDSVFGHGTLSDLLYTSVDRYIKRAMSAQWNLKKTNQTKRPLKM